MVNPSIKQQRKMHTSWMSLLSILKNIYKQKSDIDLFSLCKLGILNNEEYNPYYISKRSI